MVFFEGAGAMTGYFLVLSPAHPQTGIKIVTMDLEQNRNSGPLRGHIVKIGIFGSLKIKISLDFCFP